MQTDPSKRLFSVSFLLMKGLGGKTFHLGVTSHGRDQAPGYKLVGPSSVVLSCTKPSPQRENLEDYFNHTTIRFGPEGKS